VHGVGAEQSVELFGVHQFWRHAALGHERSEPVRRVFRGHQPANAPSRVGERGFDWVKPIEQHALGI
jgi:hypothetical protein